MDTTTKPEYFIGLMSGTSTDGVDGVIAKFTPDERVKIIAQNSLGMPMALRETFLALNKAGDNELERSHLAANDLARLYAQCCHDLLAQAKLKAEDIAAIGAHGQTVRHRPDLGFTVQLNSPALLAELTGINVIADFRSRDVAAAGQGAPFAPLLHQALFSSTEKHRVVLNLGGIANITILKPGETLRGFDTGPANVFMDMWAEQHLNLRYDPQGAWGASGQVQERLLNYWLSSEPYFNAPPPKSTGRDLFNAQWLEQRLVGFNDINPVDVMATLRALTTHSVARAIQEHAGKIDELFVCGGGSRNTAILKELQSLLACSVEAIEAYDIDSQSVESLAFAWLAHAFMQGQRLDFPALTGSRHATIAGCLYPK